MTRLRHPAAAAILGMLMVGCTSAQQTPMPTATPAALNPGAESPADLLECDGPPSDVGGMAEEFGPSTGGTTPEEAFEALIGEGLFVIPRSGYDYLGQTADRHVWAYRADGRIRAVVVVSGRFAAMVNAPYAVEEIRTCPVAEFGPDTDLGPAFTIWSTDDGRIITDIAGPAHCDWQSARLMHIEEDGVLVKQYVRDPEGIIAVPTLERYSEDEQLPDDATFSGYSTADGHELWFTPADDAAYVARPDGVVERWPRPDEPIGCA